LEVSSATSRSNGATSNDIVPLDVKDWLSQALSTLGFLFVVVAGSCFCFFATCLVGGAVGVGGDFFAGGERPRAYLAVGEFERRGEERTL